MAAIEELRLRLERYPRERYPVQHATAQFHLGLALLETGSAADAERALADAASLFDPEGLGAEHAKALNARGAALRELGQLDAAAETFAAAAAAFGRAGLRLERGAALFNLGLVRGDESTLREARSLLDPQRVPAQAAAAARELGSLLLADGELDDAAEAFDAAVEYADRAGATAELGNASNALGLVRLAQDRVDEAVATFRDAAGAHPRAVRPQEHAMAKANLALAYERSGDEPRARLAARQALAVPGCPATVRDQAVEVLELLPLRADDLFTVLEDEPPERWAAVVREEVVRWLAAPDDAAAWARGVVERPTQAVDLAEAWLATLLELPTDAMETLLEAAFAPLEPKERAALCAASRTAAARLHVPQLLRVEDALARWS